MIFSDIVSEVSPQHNITQNMFDVFASFILHSWFLILVSSDWTSSWRLDSQFIPNYDVFEHLVNIPYWLSLSLIGSWWLNQLIHNFWCVLFWWSLRAAISDGFDMFWLLHRMFRWFLRINLSFQIIFHDSINSILQFWWFLMTDPQLPGIADDFRIGSSTNLRESAIFEESTEEIGSSIG